MAEAALFDFDGVVVQSEYLHRETFLELLAPHKVSVTVERWYRDFAGTGSRHIFEVLVNEHKLGLDVGELVERRKRIYEARVKGGALKETPGIRDMLSALRGKGIRTAIVSGSHRTNIEAALEALRIGPFDLIVSGDDLKERKPDPGPFLHAAKALGADPSECVAFEDSVSGCESARRAGMRLVLVDSPASGIAGQRDLTIKDFRDSERERVLRLFP